MNLLGAASQCAVGSIANTKCPSLDTCASDVLAMVGLVSILLVETGKNAYLAFSWMAIVSSFGMAINC